MIKYIRLAPGDALGYPSYVRVVFDAGSAWTTTDGKRAELLRMVDRMRQSETAVPINSPEFVAGDRAATIDFRVVTEGKTRTVAQLVQQLNDALGFGHSVDLASIEKIPRDSAYGTTATQGRAEAVAKREREQPGNTWDQLRKIGSVAYWAVIVLIVVGVGLLLWKISRGRLV